MADYLIERRGLGGVEARFRSFSSSRDRHKNFALAFGTTLAEFEKDMLSTWWRLPPQGRRVTNGRLLELRGRHIAQGAFRSRPLSYG